MKIRSESAADILRLRMQSAFTFPYHIRHFAPIQHVICTIFSLTIAQQIQILPQKSTKGTDLAQSDSIRGLFPRRIKGTGKGADVFHQQLMLACYHYSLPNHML